MVLRCPPRILLLVLLLAAGGMLGLGAFTFVYAEGLSYFSSDPKVCVNCHVMNDEFASWSKSGHHHVATCNDCHLPHSLIPKLIAKARNGYNHSMAFTLQNYPEPIMISKHNAAILQQNCVECHKNLVHDAVITPAGGVEEAQRCTQCHRHVGHAPIH